MCAKFMPISFFRRASRFEVFQDTWRFNEENPSKPECQPSLSLNSLKLCKFVSRSDLVLNLVLDADHSLDLLSYLVFRRASRF